MKAYNTIVIDEDSSARKQLVNFLRGYPAFRVIRECSNGLEAINAINDLKPDAVFLEIEMPDVSGFEVLNHLTDHLPLIILISEFREYALEAFEVEALDYIQKPYRKKRLDKCLKRLEKRMANGKQEVGKEVIENVIDVLKEPENLERFIIKQYGEYHLIRAKEIQWIESDGNYSRVMTRDKKFMVRYTLTGFDEQLNPKKFYRISRSQIVNIDYVVKIKDELYGNYMVELKNGVSLKMSKNYKRLLEALRNF